MNLNNRRYEEFKVSDIFIVKYGVNLELNACDEIDTKDNKAINFVARTAENNGVSAYVKKINYVTPQKPGLISVAGGGSVLSTFLQNEPFYSGRDLYTLEAKESLSDETKMFIITTIEQNKYKYSYGRQANKTLPDLLLKLPIQQNDDGTPYIDNTRKFSKYGFVPDWHFMEDYIKSLHHKPITTKNTHRSEIKTDKWKDFSFGKLIKEPYKAHAYSKDELEENVDSIVPSIRYITRTAENNGCEMIVNCAELKYIEDGNAISIGDTTATCFYQEEQFVTGDHMIVIRADWLNTYTGLFITTLLNNERYRYSYGRAFLMDRVKETVLKLPICRDKGGLPIIDKTKQFSDKGYIPDWQFIEDCIKSLPYGDRIF